MVLFLFYYRSLVKNSPGLHLSSICFDMQFNCKQYEGFYSSYYISHHSHQRVALTVFILKMQQVFIFYHLHIISEIAKSIQLVKDAVDNLWKTIMGPQQEYYFPVATIALHPSLLIKPGDLSLNDAEFTFASQIRENMMMTAHVTLGKHQ